MQKKMIVLALAAISAAPAFAQSNVTIYGRVDYGYLQRSGNDGGVVNAQSKGEFAAGLQAGSRVGFRGTEDLGNGLKAIFQVEYGIGNDSVGGNLGAPASAATWVNRNSSVGLTGNWGTVVGGRLDGVRYGIFNKYDAFQGGTVGNFTQMTSQIDRADNAIAYVSPRFSGFQVTLAHSTSTTGQENVGNNDDLKLYTIMGNYENGPISLTADYETIRTNDPTAAFIGGTLAGIADPEVKVWTLAGSYDFGVVKVSALWDSHKTEAVPAGGGAQFNAVDYRDYFISASVPFAGKFTGKFTWGKVDDKTAANADSSKWGIGLNYALSKRTGLYADYGKISNDTGATQRISASANANAMFGGSGGASNAAGFNNIGVKGFDIGIAHTF